MVRIVRHSGRYMGLRVNHAEDAQAFREFLHRWIDRFAPAWLRRRSIPRWREMEDDFRRCVRAHRLPLRNPHAPWGWKNPRSFYILPFLHQAFPGLRYLHVVRDGRDMAFSRNQNGLKWHGHAVLAPEVLARSQPVSSIALWSQMNAATARYGEAHLGDRYMCVRLEDLCASPDATVQRVCVFAGEGETEPSVSRSLRFLLRDLRCSPPDAVTRAWRRWRRTGRLAWRPEEEVELPSSLGRWRREDPELIRELEQVGEAGLARFGYL